MTLLTAFVQDFVKVRECAIFSTIYIVWFEFCLKVGKKFEDFLSRIFFSGKKVTERVKIPIILQAISSHFRENDQTL